MVLQRKLRPSIARVNVQLDRRHASSKRTTAPVNHTRPSPCKHSPDGTASARKQASDYSILLSLSVYFWKWQEFHDFDMSHMTHDVMWQTGVIRQRFAKTHTFSPCRADSGRTRRRKSSRRMRRTSSTSPGSCRRRCRRCWRRHDPEVSGTRTSLPTSWRCRRRVEAAPSRSVRRTAIDIRRTSRRRRPACREHAPGRTGRIRRCRCATRQSRDHIRYREYERRTRNCRPLERSAVPAARRRCGRVKTPTSASQRWCSTVLDVVDDSCSYTIITRTPQLDLVIFINHSPRAVYHASSNKPRSPFADQTAVMKDLWKDEL